MSTPINDAFAAAEVRLKTIRQEIIDLTDAGADAEYIIRVKQGSLERWFDQLECVSGLLRSAASLSSALREGEK